MCLLKKPKLPAISAPPPPPKIPAPPREVDQAVLNARARERNRASAAFGHTASILTGGRGVTSQANLATPSLLGDRGQSEEATVRRSDTANVTNPGVPNSIVSAQNASSLANAAGQSAAERLRLQRRNINQDLGNRTSRTSNRSGFGAGFRNGTLSFSRSGLR